MIAYLYRAASYIVFAVLFLAVAWQSLHLLDWVSTLWDAHAGDGIAAYLRQHAYTYTEHVFGDLLNWRLGE